MKNKEVTRFEEWEKRRLNLSNLRTWGCLAKVNVLINKKRKLGPKIVDCVFLGYAIHSVGYRFLIINSKVLIWWKAQSWNREMLHFLKMNFP
jgi:hypothetical protein